MTLDELEEKIISIRKRGLNILLENELIALVRKDYYDIQIEKQIGHMSNRFRNNVLFLNSLHKENCSAQKIKEFMGVDIDVSVNKIFYGDRNIYSLKQAIIISEFFGLPVELLLFQDLSAIRETIQKEYPTLFRQSRN
jgi:hypothetical protein